MGILEKISIFKDIIDMLKSVGGGILALLTGKVKASYSNRCLKKVLGFKDKRCGITIPIFKKNIYGKRRNVALIEEIELRQKVMQEMIRLKIHVDDNPEANTPTENEIHIGGPVANIRTNTYIKNYFPKFKIGVNDEHLRRYQRENLKEIYQQILITGCTTEGIYYGEELEHIVEYERFEKDCAVLVKLTKEDLKSDRTVHLLFGCGQVGTSNAVNYFLHNHKKLYKEYRGGHYFVIFPVNHKDKSLVESGKMDLTDCMFE